MNNNSALGALRRRWWVIVLFALVGAIIGAIPEPQQVEEQLRTFTATHTLLLNDSNTNINTNQSVVSPSQVTLFVSTGEVPRRVADELDFGGNAATLAAQVTSEFDNSTGALTISTTQEEARRAELVADTFADELTSYLAERQDAVYQDRLAAALQRLADLEVELNDVTLALAANPESPTLSAQQSAVSRQYSVAFEQSEELTVNPPVLGFTTIQRAEAVDITDRGISAPTGRTSRAILGMLVGAALGAGVALLLGQLDRRLRTREQAEFVMDMRARVTIPKVSDSDRDQIVVALGRHDPLSDSYRTVRNVIGFVTPDDVSGAPVTLVVSPGPGDGKTSLAANVAASMAETGKRTILINTDFRRPRLASVLGPAATVPLPFTLEDLDRLDARSLLSKTDRDNLLLMDLSTIDGSPGELLRATIDKLPELKQIADAIVIDTSPVGVTAEALDLVPFADVITVIARVGGTQIASAQRTIAILRDLATAPMILVLSGIKMEKADYYEYTNRKRRERSIRVPRRPRRARSADGAAGASVAAVEDAIDVPERNEGHQRTMPQEVLAESALDDDTGELLGTDDLFDADDLFQFDEQIRAAGSSASDEPAGVRAPDAKPVE
jgi:Mrp family chromosome partitioning ATPase